MPVKVCRVELSSPSFTGLLDLRAGGAGVTVGPFCPAACPLCPGTGAASTWGELDWAPAVVKSTTKTPNNKAEVLNRRILIPGTASDC